MALVGAAPSRRSAAAASTAALRSSRGVMCSVMVRLTGEDLVRAEQLLEQHDAGQQVRQRHRSERDPLVAVLELGAERAADDQADVAAGLALGLDPLGEGLRAALLAAGVEQADPGAIGDAAGDL